MMKFTNQYLREMRKEAGLTQPQLAMKSGVHLNTVNRLENEKCDCNTRTLDRILNALGYEIEIVRLR